MARHGGHSPCDARRNCLEVVSDDDVNRFVFEDHISVFVVHDIQQESTKIVRQVSIAPAQRFYVFSGR